MYANLTLKNFKRSVKDYGIYFVTILFCSALFYAIISLSSENYKLITEESLNFDMLQKTLKYSAYFITVVLGFLVLYVNNYMLKRRYKEFGTYILLGMQQKSVSYMFFFESLMVGIFAVLCGIFVGIVFSQVLTILILVSADQTVIFEFAIYFDTVLQTFLFFIIIFIIVGITSIFIFNRIKLVDMMKKDKQTEFKFKRSGKVYMSVFIVGVTFYIVSFISFSSLVNAIIEKTPIATIQTALIGSLAFIIGTYTIFYSISYVIVFIKEKCLGFKYKGSNLFLIGSISSNIRTAPMLMATISITLLGGIISFMLSLMMAQWAIGYLEYRVPFDIAIHPAIVEENGQTVEFNTDYDSVISELKGEEYGGSNFIKFNTYFVEDNSEYDRQLAIKLSDFNKLRKNLGYDEVSLKDGEYALQWDKVSADMEMDDYLKNTKNINIDGQNLSFDGRSFKESIGEGIFDFQRNALIYIIADKYLEGKNVIRESLIANLKSNIAVDKIEKLEDSFSKEWLYNNKAQLEKLENSHRIYPYVTIKSVERNVILNATLGMRILGMYLGIILFMISLTILGLKQLIDSIDNKERFYILKKLGIEKKDINKIMLKQISIYFLTVLLIAIIGFILFMTAYVSIYGVVINNYIGDSAFILNTMVAVTIMIIIYASYYIATYKTFKRNVWS